MQEAGSNPPALSSSVPLCSSDDLGGRTNMGQELILCPVQKNVKPRVSHPTILSASSAPPRKRSSTFPPLEESFQTKT
ncbi:hypothetical protein AMEX_G12483 [Astyanax mexicanus]|uniref:Uncharacterized protein n=1 Tax=Astyanax mexicanus TaxID=7994 RepID=A0A8T2LX22_ASTMX|nr:hypothetical protein AMEX_G12483 [Astyanax mexicanus]